MFRKLLATIPAAILLVIPALASAHTVVTPATVNVGETVTFSVSVPNEKTVPVTNVKLILPPGLEEVTPLVKTGWTITTSTDGRSKDPTSIAIIWSDGTIPTNLADEFYFRAQVPATATDLNWKAYQTYADGSIVHWDQIPASSDDSTGDAGPYSVTKVADDLTSKTTAQKSTSTTVPLVISLIAVVISVASALFNKK